MKTNNHPANGPLTTERLGHVRDVLQRNLQYSNGGSMDYIIADAVKAIDELLEMRKAEPVAYIRSAHKPDGFCFADGIHPTHRHQRLPLSTLQDGCYWKVTPLYAAPPAPVVPPEIEPDYEVIKGILPTANPDEYACCIAADMWNACRAAMLNKDKNNG